MASRRTRKPSLFNRLFPDISDADGARAATRNAAVAGFLSAGLTFLAIVLTGATDLGELDGLVDAWALIDVGILAALAFGTLRANRYAATGLLGYYLLSQVLTRMEFGWSRGIGLALVFVVLFVQGARGAWELWRRRSDPELEAMVDALAEPDRTA